MKAALIGLAILLGIWLVTGGAHWGKSTDAQCAPSATAAVAGPDTDRVLGRLGESNMPISYVLVVDVSAAMSEDDRYAEVQQAMGRLIISLAPQDDLAIVTFANTATTVLALSPRGSGAPPFPVLPPHPAGSRTNIGLGIEKGIATLQDAPPGQPAVLVLLTDSEQEASYGTRFADTYSADWTALHAQAELTRKDRPVDAYAVPLGAKTDVDLMCTVYSGAALMPASTSGDTLTSYLSRVEANGRLKAAAALVQRNNGQGVRASWELPPNLNINTGATTATLQLTNGAPNFPVVIDGAQVVADGELPSVASDLPRHIELGPAETKRIPVHLSWSSPGALSIISTGRRGYTTTLSIAGAVSSPLAAELAELPLGGEPLTLAPSVSGTGHLVGTGAVGYLPVLPIAAGLLALLALLALERAYPPLPGDIALFRKKADKAVDDRDQLVSPALSLATNRWAVYRILSGRRRVGTWTIDHGKPDTRAKVTVRGRRKIVGKNRGNEWVEVRVQLTGMNRSAKRRLPLGGTRMILGIEVKHLRHGASQELSHNEPTGTTLPFSYQQSSK